MRKMSIDLRDYSLLCRYVESNREGKTKLLNELCDLHGYNRKYLLQEFNQLTGKRYLRRGRKRRYEGNEILEPLKRIWLASDPLCSKRLKAAIPLWIPYYDKELSSEVKQQLVSLSPASIDRLLKPHCARYKRRGLSGTKPGYLLKNQIPIKTDHWEVTGPGFMEADTVAHCGQSLAGQFIWSITLTDIASGWTEIRATWNKGSLGVVNSDQKHRENASFSRC